MLLFRTTLAVCGFVTPRIEVETGIPSFIGQSNHFGTTRKVERVSFFAFFCLKKVIGIGSGIRRSEVETDIPPFIVPLNEFYWNSKGGGGNFLCFVTPRIEVETFPFIHSSAE